MTGEEIDARQQLAVKLLDWACNGERGIGENDPKYQLVTEGRDTGRFQRSYSSCGDLAHWLLFRLGVREPWINRAEHRGWKTGENVSRLAFKAPKDVRQLPVPGSRFEPGDVLIIWNDDQGRDAHVMVVYEHRPDLARLVVAEYGQPGGHVRKRHLHASNGFLWVGTRKVQRWLPLRLVLEHSDVVNVSMPDVPDTIPAPPLEGGTDAGQP